MGIKLHSFLFILIFASISGILSGCSNEDDRKEEPEKPVSVACLYENTITISDINGIPKNVTFDKVKANISGSKWQVIADVEADYKDGSATLVLPSAFSSDKLQIAERPATSYDGYWPGKVSDPEAKVAALGDIFAYNGTKKVGRISLSDWPRKGSSAGKAFIYYHYADRVYNLSGKNTSYYYTASFNKGWNAYANINPASETTTGNINCTTSIPDTNISWYFESYVY